MSDYQQILTHEQDAIDNFIWIFRGNEAGDAITANNGSLIVDGGSDFITYNGASRSVKYLIPGSRFQARENTLNDIYRSHSLDYATGVSLTKSGEEVGVIRPLPEEDLVLVNDGSNVLDTGSDYIIYSGSSVSDDTFRLLTKAQIAANWSNSTIGDLDKVLSILGANTTNIRYIFPAGLFVNYSGITALAIQDVLNLLVSATAPVSIDISKSTAHPFGFYGDPRAFGFNDGQLGGSIPNVFNDYVTNQVLTADGGYIQDINSNFIIH